MKKYFRDMRGRYNTFLTWMGHRFLIIMSTTYTYSLSSAIICWYLHIGSVWNWLICAPMVAGMVFGFLGGSYHQDNLCPDCYVDMPLNPGELATGKYRKYLKREHWMDDKIKYILVGYLAVIFVGSLITKYTPFLFGQFYVATLGFAAYYLSYHRILHTRYYPWCPYCDHGGDWDREEIQEPDPSGVSQ